MRAMVRRSPASSAPAWATVSHLLVPTSICERRNSGETRSPSSCSQRVIRLSGGSTTRSRVSRSTRRYSSSMPTVKLGSGRAPPLPMPVRLRFSRSRVLDAIERGVAQHRLQRRAEALGPEGGALLGIDEVLAQLRSEEHTYELQSLMRSSYAVFCLQNKIKHNDI